MDKFVDEDERKQNGTFVEVCLESKMEKDDGVEFSEKELMDELFRFVRTGPAGQF